VTLAVVAMLPLDTSQLPRREHLPPVSEDWRTTGCAGCSRAAWVSPAQEEIKALKLCYYCIESLVTSGEYKIGQIINLTKEPS
jgi:hypothetical protein